MTQRPEPRFPEGALRFSPSIAHERDFSTRESRLLRSLQRVNLPISSNCVGNLVRRHRSLQNYTVAVPFEASANKKFWHSWLS